MKVCKFGGSSLSKAENLKKVKEIIEADPSRKAVVVSAPGKRFSEDNKVTDLLYITQAHLKYKVKYDDIWAAEPSSAWMPISRSTWRMWRGSKGPGLFWNLSE